jgi:hypothetical protein
MEYSIRMAFGNSELTWTAGLEDSAHGTIQGNGLGPPTYLCTSAPIYKMMEAEGLGAKIVTSITQQVMEYLGFAFVDDTENISQGATPIEAVLTMQALLDAWANRSRVTGGVLVPKKSHWFLVDPVSLPDGSFHYH